MKINGEAIFGTRPWPVSGEGPTKVASGHFGEASAAPFTADDVRFTSKGDALFAIALGKPATLRLTLKSLASHVAGSVERVEMLGSPSALRFTRDAQGLTLELPLDMPGEHAIVFKIMGRDLTEGRHP